MSTKQPKAWKGWAVFTKDGQLVVYRGIAGTKRFFTERVLFPGDHPVRVEVRPLPPKRERPLTGDEQAEVDDITTNVMGIETPDDFMEFERKIADLVRRLHDAEVERDEARRLAEQWRTVATGSLTVEAFPWEAS